MAISIRPKNAKIDPRKVLVDFKFNARSPDDYNVQELYDKVCGDGRITDAITVETGKFEVNGIVYDFRALRGNRRTLVAQKIIEDPQSPQDLVTNVSKLEAVVYDGEKLTEEERTELMFDHGGMKPLGRFDTVNAVLRLDRMMWSETRIIHHLYYLLARYTRNENKLKDLPSDGKLKAKFLTSWFHGTVGNQILRAARMGPLVREMFLLTAREEDGKLTDEEKVRLESGFRTSTKRISALSAAVTADQKEAVEIAQKEATANGLAFTKSMEEAAEAKGWTNAGGGTTFNILLAQYIKNDKEGIKDDASAVVRPTVEKIKQMVAETGGYRSTAIKTTLLASIGDEVAKQKMPDLDDQLAGLQIKMEILLKEKGKVTDDRVIKLVNAILNGPPAGVEDAIKVFQS